MPHVCAVFADMGVPTGHSGENPTYPRPDHHELRFLYALMDKRSDSKRASLMLYSIQISACIMSQVDITSKDFGRYAAVVPVALGKGFSQVG